jgi:hypothetical protein
MRRFVIRSLLPVAEPALRPVVWLVNTLADRRLTVGRVTVALTIQPDVWWGWYQTSYGRLKGRRYFCAGLPGLRLEVWRAAGG